MTPDGNVVITQTGTLNVLIDAGLFEFLEGQIMTFIVAERTGGGEPLVYIFPDDGPQAP